MNNNLHETLKHLERQRIFHGKYPINCCLFYVLGDALFFHSNVLHASDANNSSNRRWALIMAYNRKSNNPLESLAPPFPRYTPLEKVNNHHCILGTCTSNLFFKYL